MVLFSENHFDCESNVSAKVVVTCGEAPANYEIRTVSSPARVPLTDHATEQVVLPAELAVTNACNISTDVRQYPTDCANKTLQLCQPLSAIDTQKKIVAEYINDHDVVGTGSTYSARATVNSLWRNLPSINRSTLQEGTPTCQRMKLACDNCDKTFTSSSGLLKHALIHKDGRSHSCSYCGKQFNRHENMLRHQRGHTGVKPFKCSVCGKAFGHNITLARHQVIHTGDRPYSCDICGQTFSWKTSLTSHRLTHSRHKPNVCAVCGRAFHAKQGLRRHMKVHTDVRSYKCDVCGQAFSHSSILASHRQTHSNIRPHRCSDCGQSFARKYDLRRHLKIHKKPRHANC